MPYGDDSGGINNNRSQHILRAGPSHDRRMQDRNRHTLGSSSIDRHSVSINFILNSNLVMKMLYFLICASFKLEYRNQFQHQILIIY